MPSQFDEAAELLRARGITLRQVLGEYHVNFRHGESTTEFVTDDLADALAHGLAMGDAPASPPPLGPMGKGMTRWAKMYRHNRALAARRRKRGGAASG
jgi:hypothetical protein